MPLHPIIIRPVLNGYTVQVGCQHLAFHDRNVLIKELRDYLERPEETERRYRKEAMNASLLTEQYRGPQPVLCTTQSEPGPERLNQATPANPTDAGCVGETLPTNTAMVGRRH